VSTAHEGNRPIRFAAVGLDHAHAFGQIEGLLDQVCQLVGFSCDDQAAAVGQAVRHRRPEVIGMDGPTSLLADPSIDVIVTAAVPERRYVDVAGRPGGDHLFVVDGAGTEYIDCSDVQLSYYPDLVSDVINRTEAACPQRHTLEMMPLAMRAEQNAAMLRYAQ
jgi:hypothetical protein